MILLRTIRDQQYSIGINWKKRDAARAILFNENNLVPLLYVAKQEYHKLPGGGVYKNEKKTHALAREVKEEVGSDIEIVSELGKIIEYRTQWKLKQTSYCYLGNIISKGIPKFTKEEMRNGFELIWVSLEEAIEKVTNDTTSDYEGAFIQERDLTFLRKACEF
jgi:8-oxo-dGTP diphosphatase